MVYVLGKIRGHLEIKLAFENPQILRTHSSLIAVEKPCFIHYNEKMKFEFVMRCVSNDDVAQVI